MTTIKNGFKSTQFLLVNYCCVISFFVFLLQKALQKAHTWYRVKQGDRKKNIKSEPLPLC